MVVSTKEINIVAIVVPIVTVLIIAAAVLLYIKHKYKTQTLVTVPIWQIKNVVILDRLGGGQFGDVFLGILDVSFGHFLLFIKRKQLK